MCLQFNFKGMEINNLDTPKKLNMSNGDVIDIYKDDMEVAVTSLQFLLDGMKVDQGPPEEEFLKFVSWVKILTKNVKFISVSKRTLK